MQQCDTLCCYGRQFAFVSKRGCVQYGPLFNALLTSPGEIRHACKQGVYGPNSQYQYALRSSVGRQCL